MLATLRKGDVPEAPDTKALSAWLGHGVTKGRTTRSEIIALFGTRHTDLDRPERDGVRSIQYFLGPRGSSTQWAYLVFELGRKTDVLVDWSMSHAICGYCPHVFAHDGRWRLEGKLLAGCVGSEREGVDALVLPRLRPEGGRARITLANLAPEWEYLDELRLGVVALRPGEELDVSAAGRPVVWRPVAEHAVRLGAAGGERAEASQALDGATDLVVLEARNTSGFEGLMRKTLLAGGPGPRRTDLEVLFDDGAVTRVSPVGTKFLRRVAIPVPPRARRLTLRAHRGLWTVRRLWTGTRREAPSELAWLAPIRAWGATSALGLVRERDGHRLCLPPMAQVVLEFDTRGLGDSGRLACVLRARGYYEFAQVGTCAGGFVAPWAQRDEP